MTMKEQVKMMNQTAEINFDMADGMLRMFNEIHGTKFGWNNKRVVIYENPENHLFSKIHDAYAWMQ